MSTPPLLSRAGGTLPARRRRAPLRRAVLELAARLRPRRISAMIRVKNEEEFLAAAVGSIAASVDEIILIDNASTDATPAVIASLCAEYPRLIAVHRYPLEIARVGGETWRLLTASGGASPHLSGVYYNWCLRRCRQPYVLKWDGDMIATPAFHRAITGWKRARAPILMMRGANVHPDRRHLAASRSSDRGGLLAQQECPRMPGWVRSMTFDYLEPRLFPRRRARYAHGEGFTQSLVSPFLDRRFSTVLRREIAEPAYLHMKFCKRDPYSNYSEDLAGVIAANLTIGPRLDARSLRLLERWACGAATRPCA
jgi:glycosyltransferase involved in cell wall biosynthesis